MQGTHHSAHPALWSDSSAPKLHFVQRSTAEHGSGLFDDDIRAWARLLVAPLDQ